MDKKNKNSEIGKIPCYHKYPLWKFEPKYCCQQRLCSGCKIKLTRMNKYARKWRESCMGITNKERMEMMEKAERILQEVISFSMDSIGKGNKYYFYHLSLAVGSLQLAIKKLEKEDKKNG